MARTTKLRSTHQDRDGSHQHAQSSAQRSAKHEPCTQREKRPRDEAHRGEDVDSREGNGTQPGVFLNPLQEGNQGICNVTQLGKLHAVENGIR